MLVCEECGGSNVQVLAWVDANTNEHKREGPCAGEIESNWCEDCSAHVYLTDKEEYDKNNEEDED